MYVESARILQKRNSTARNAHCKAIKDFIHCQ
jgi:hypothetical protein